MDENITDDISWKLFFFRWVEGAGWATFQGKTKLKSTLVHFSFTHPLPTLIPDILPPSLSLVRLTEQEKPVRVKMKGRWGCAERVWEINECPPLSLMPIGDVLPRHKIPQKPPLQVRMGVTMLWPLVCVCVFIPAPQLVPVFLGILTPSSAQQGSFSTIIIQSPSHSLEYRLILWRCNLSRGGAPEKYTLFTHYSNHQQQGCPHCKEKGCHLGQMRRKSEAVDVRLAVRTQRC